MPGVCGVVTVAGDPGPLLASMTAAMCHYDWHVVQTSVSAGFGVARVGGTRTMAGPEDGWVASASGRVAACDGELHALGAEAAEWEASPAGRVLGLVTSGGRAALNHVHGCFTAAIWDAGTGELVLANDRFGMRPLYWTVARGQLLFASEVTALLAHADVSRSLSTVGLAEFFSFGHFLGDTTLYESIHALPPAAWLTWNRSTGQVTVTRYDTPPVATPSRTTAGWLEAIEAHFTRSVATSCRGDALGLSLSGGLDARTILGVAPPDVPLTCVSLGVRGGIDHRAASRLADLARRPHHAHLLDGDFLGQFETLFRQTVRLTYGHYLDQGIVLSTLPAYRNLGVRTLLRGHAGELMHMRKAYAFSLDAEALALSSRPEVSDWLWTHLSGYMIGAVDEALWAGGRAVEFRDAARASLDRRLADVHEAGPPLQAVWRLFVEDRLRRETSVSMHLFRSFVEVRLPYLDPELVATLLAAPVELKLGDAIQTHILRTHMPSFLRVVNANTGAPMGASAFRLRLSNVGLRALSKLRVPGYQPYERLGLWLARDLQPLVRRTLLSDRFLSQGVFAPDRVRQLIDQHSSRKRNHTFLLMAMLVFALGHCER